MLWKLKLRKVPSYVHTSQHVRWAYSRLSYHRIGGDQPQELGLNRSIPEAIQANPKLPVQSQDVSILKSRIEHKIPPYVLQLAKRRKRPNCRGMQSRLHVCTRNLCVFSRISKLAISEKHIFYITLFHCFPSLFFWNVCQHFKGSLDLHSLEQNLII